MLRDYQNDAVRETYASLRQLPSAILQMPTGSGKTHVAAAIILQGLRMNRRVWFCVDRLTLIDQTVDKFAEQGIRCGVIQAQHPLYDPAAPVQVCSLQTLARRKRSGWRSPHLVIVDECHDQHQVTYDLMEEYAEAKFIGLSATPFTTGLGNHWADLVVATTTAELMDSGWLAKYEAYGPSVPDMVGVATSLGDWVAGGAAERMEPLKGDIVSHYEALAGGKKAVCFTATVAQAKGLAVEFNKAGHNADYVCGKDSDERRAAVLAAYHSGEVTVLCNCEVLTKGWDAPDVEVAIIARPTKSLSKHIQMLGRVLRIDGEKVAKIIDHAGNIARLGFPDDALPQKLCTRTKGTSEADRVAAGEQRPWACSGCKHLNDYAQPTCLACGEGRRPAREKVETVPEVLQVLKRENRADKQTVYGMLNQIAKERGYKKGWVSHSYRALFGVWPRGLADVTTNPTEEVRAWVKERIGNNRKHYYARGGGK